MGRNSWRMAFNARHGKKWYVNLFNIPVLVFSPSLPLAGQMDTAWHETDQLSSQSANYQIDNPNQQLLRLRALSSPKTRSLWCCLCRLISVGALTYSLAEWLVMVAGWRGGGWFMGKAHKVLYNVVNITCRPPPPPPFSAVREMWWNYTLRPQLLLRWRDVPLLHTATFSWSRKKRRHC